MESTINERINKIIDVHSKSISDFARKLNRPTGTITSITTGRSKPGSELLEEIITVFPTVDPLWLLCGKGDMLVHSNEIAPKLELQLIEALERERKVLVNDIEELKKDKERLWSLLENRIGKKHKPASEEQSAWGKIITFYPEMTEKIFA